MEYDEKKKVWFLYVKKEGPLMIKSISQKYIWIEKEYEITVMARSFIIKCDKIKNFLKILEIKAVDAV